MPHHERPCVLGKRPLLAAALLVAVVLPESARAAEPKVDSSLGLIPADAAFYNSMLRNRQQFDAVANSKTWARLAKLPYYQMGMMLLKKQYEEGDAFAVVRQWIEQQENRDLVEMLRDAVSTEMFCYGAGNWVDFIDLVQQTYNAGNYGQLQQLIKDPQFQDQKAMQNAPLHSMLRALARNPNKIKTPDVVIGFKIKNAQKAEAQIKRLEMLLENLLPILPMMEGRLKRVKVGDGNFLTLRFDGDMIPWDEIDWKDLEEAAGEFDGVRKALKKLQLTISLGVRDGFLLFSLGSSTDGLKQLGGAGPRLSSRAELKPLLRAADKQLTGISYTSKARDALSHMTAADIDSLTTQATHALDALGVPEDKRKAILKDVSRLVDDLKKNITPPGASLGFSYLSERGYEGFDYQYGDFSDRDSSKKLTLLDHVGGDPILAFVGRSKGDREAYQTFSKWLKIAYGHAEPLILAKLNEQNKQQYKEIGKIIFPLLKRFDAITGQMLLPSLADGQAGFALDAKWKSKQWHAEMPASDKALPMLELALVVGVSDRELLEKAMKSYAKLIEDALVKVKEHAPPDAQPPFTKLPEAEVKTAKTGKLYLWHLPEELKLDRQVAVTAGLSDKVGVVALSAAHAERVLARKPLKIEGGPLADNKRPLIGASYLNWPGFIDALSPWVMFTIAQIPLDKSPPGGEEKNQRAAIVRHAQVVLHALKAIRVSTSATYLEGGALITHSEVVIRDE